MSPALAALSLDPEETVLWSSHPRWLLILPDSVVGAVLVAVGLLAVVGPDAVSVLPEWAVLLLGILIPLGIALPAWGALSLLNTRFVITDRALYVKRGVLRTRVDRINHSRVQNSSTTQGIRGKLFGYGTVAVDTAGVSNAIRFHDINDPRTVRERIDGLAGAPDETELPGSVEQWTAVLEEVRALRTALESR